MNRFLAHLVARATQRGPLLERRQPSLFEPRAGRVEVMSGSGATPPPTEVDAMAVARVRPTTRVAPPETLRADDVAAGRARAPVPGPLAGMREAMAPAESSVSPMVRQAAPRDHVSVPTSEVRPGAARLSALAHVGDQVVSAGTPTAIHSAPERIPALSPIAASVQAPAAASSAALTAEPAPHETTHPRSQVESEWSPSARHAQVAEMSPLHQAVQLAKAVAPRLDPASSAQAEKTVQITIGRVEVRAVGATERNAARPTKSVPARLSLDDYLRERSRGAR